MSDTAQQAPEVAGGPPPEPETGGRAWSMVKRAAVLFAEQRAATVLVVVILLVVYFGFFSSASSTFLTKDNIANITWTLAPWAIIAIGEVFLLVCGELDLSVGFVLGFSPFLMHYLIDFYGVPPVLAVLLCLLMGLAVGFANGFITVTLGVPSFITTLGTGFIIEGILLVTSHAYPATIPASAAGVGNWLGSWTWAEITWTIVLVAVFQMVLSYAVGPAHGRGRRQHPRRQRGRHQRAPDQVRELHDHRLHGGADRAHGDLPDQLHRPE